MTAIDSRAKLREAGLFPKKSFGQNFLVTEQVARTIATACIPDAEMGRARVVELGAGLGALTALLAERAAHVVAIERDRDLVPILRATFPDANVEIVEADAQAFDVAAALGAADAPRVLCGNLPYQITGKLLQLAVECAGSIDRAVFMVQQEVCDRLVAKPGTKEYGALTVFVRAAFDVRRVMNVARGSFHPPPDVTSSVVELTALRPARALETPTFRAVVKGAFETRRKTLRNSWSRVAAAPDEIARAAAAVGISLDARGETLDVDDFARMAAEIERGAK